MFSSFFLLLKLYLFHIHLMYHQNIYPKTRAYLSAMVRLWGGSREVLCSLSSPHRRAPCLSPSKAPQSWMACRKELWSPLESFADQQWALLSLASTQIETCENQFGAQFIFIKVNFRDWKTHWHDVGKDVVEMQSMGWRQHFQIGIGFFSDFTYSKSITRLVLLTPCYIVNILH